MGGKKDSGAFYDGEFNDADGLVDVIEGVAIRRPLIVMRNEPLADTFVWLAQPTSTLALNNLNNNSQGFSRSSGRRTNTDERA
jgi:hypothetical protein